MAEDKRPLRGCDVCGGVDTDPRHVFGYPVGEGATDPEVAAQMLDNAPPEARTAVLAHIQDSATSMRHLDCCREAGCPDGTCDVVTKGAEDLRGADLVAHLTKEN